jgi:hypothetical protein
MAEPIFAIQIGELSCFCFYNPTGPIHSGHELSYMHVEEDVEEEERPRHRKSKRRRGAGGRSRDDLDAPGVKETSLRSPGSVRDIGTRPSRALDPDTLEPLEPLEAEMSPARGEGGPELPDGAIADQGSLSPSSQKAASLPKKMNLSGMWTCTRVEGNIDGFLAEIGVNWLLRRTARAFGWGVGVLTNSIKHNGDYIEIVQRSPKGSFTSKFRLDGTEQHTHDPLEGRPITSLPKWEQGFQAIFTESRRSDTGLELPTTRRYLVGEEMCVEQCTPLGVTIKRYFKRT